MPKLQGAGWNTEPHSINEQVTFTDGRIIVAGRQCRRRIGNWEDIVLRYRAYLPFAVVEAKLTYATLGKGLQQANDGAELQGLKFAFVKKGSGIFAFD